MRGITDRFCSNEIVNPGRQKEVDFAKALIIFALAFVHITIECCTTEEMYTGLPFFFDAVIGSPYGASVFMLAMGFGMVYTKKNSPRDFVKRGLVIAAAGYALNVFRILIPSLIGYAISGDSTQYLDTMWYRFFGNDILQFAPLVFFLMALLIKLGLRPGGICMVGLIMSLVALFFNGIDLNSPVLNTALGYFIGTEDAAEMVVSDFPLLNWFIVPAVGYWFGNLDIRMTEENEKKWYKLTTPVSLIVSIAYIVIENNLELGMYGEGENVYYHISTPDVICCIVASYSLIGVCYFAGRNLPELAERIIFDISKNITSIYCIHWVLVAFIVRVWIYCVKGTQLIPYGYVLLLSFAVMLASIILAHYWDQYTMASRQRRRNEKA